MFLGYRWSGHSVIAHSNGFSITTSNVFLPRICPPSHPTVQTWSFFSQCHLPKTASHLMCLTIFTWMPWNARLPVEIFPKAEEVHNNAALASVPVVSSPNFLVSSLIGSFQNRYRELCVSHQWRNLQALKSLDLAMHRVETWPR